MRLRDQCGPACRLAWLTCGALAAGDVLGTRTTDCTHCLRSVRSVYAAIFVAIKATSTLATVVFMRCLRLAVCHPLRTPVFERPRYDSRDSPSRAGSSSSCSYPSEVYDAW